LYQRLQGDRVLARKIGRSLGLILAEQHSRISADDTKEWLPSTLRWPEPWETIEARLPGVVHETDLLCEIKEVIDRCQTEEIMGSGECVLVHGDLGLHNIAIEPNTGTVEGVFDYDGAAWADRHYDFRYLIFDQQDEDLLNGAMEVYEDALGVKLDRSRIRLYNAACAIGFLAFRQGTHAEALSCGRTLAQDLEWVRCSLRAIR
jgi:aminoglycoside phosphotransferase (APT) family kinase protein